MCYVFMIMVQFVLTIMYQLHSQVHWWCMFLPSTDVRSRFTSSGLLPKVDKPLSLSNFFNSVTCQQSRQHFAIKPADWLVETHMLCRCKKANFEPTARQYCKLCWNNTAAIKQQSAYVHLQITACINSYPGSSLTSFPELGNACDCGCRV